MRTFTSTPIPAPAARRCHLALASKLTGLGLALLLGLTGCAGLPTPSDTPAPIDDAPMGTVTPQVIEPIDPAARAAAAQAQTKPAKPQVQALAAEIVYFSHRATALTPEQRAKVFALAQKVKAAPQHIGTLVVGHADPSEGNTAEQEKLSRMRTEYVARLLVIHGLPTAMIRPQHRAANDPMIPKGAVAQKGVSNRRVEIQAVARAD